MDRHCSRRAALAALGSAALAGCYDGVDSESYWGDPPSFDDDGLDAVTATPAPERPDPLPVGVADERAAEFTSRVETLLAPVPEELTAEELPNGAIRTAIRDARRDAEDGLERTRATAYALETATAAADACASAAKAAAIWAHVSVDDDLAALPIDPGDVGASLQRATDAIPDAAAEPSEGAVVYAPVEEWFRTAPSRIYGGSSVGREADPLETGDTAADLERVRTRVAVGLHLRDRYAASLERAGAGGAGAIERVLQTALDDLAPVANERMEAFHGGDAEHLLRPPRVDDYLSADVPADAPGPALLAERMHSFPQGYRQPIAWPTYETEWPALALRNTHSALAHLDAFDAVRTRIEDGDDLFPDDAAAIEAARSDAVDAVDDLAAGDDPFARWQAWQLAPEVESADEALVPGADRQEVAASYTTYVWVATFAAQVSDASATVQAALPS